MRHLSGNAVGFGGQLPPSVSLVICFHWESPQESRLPRFFPMSLRRPAGLREGGRGDGEAKGTRGPGSGNALAPSSRLRALQQPLLGVLGLKTWCGPGQRGRGGQSLRSLCLHPGHCAVPRRGPAELRRAHPGVLGPQPPFIRMVMAWATVLRASSPLQGPGRKGGRRSWETTSPGKQVSSEAPFGYLARCSREAPASGKTTGWGWCRWTCFGIRQR